MIPELRLRVGWIALLLLAPACQIQNGLAPIPGPGQAVSLTGSQPGAPGGQGPGSPEAAATPEGVNVTFRIVTRDDFVFGTPAPTPDPPAPGFDPGSQADGQQPGPRESAQVPATPTPGHGDGSSPGPAWTGPTQPPPTSYW